MKAHCASPSILTVTLTANQLHACRTPSLHTFHKLGPWGSRGLVGRGACSPTWPPSTLAGHVTTRAAGLPVLTLLNLCSNTSCFH